MLCMSQAGAAAAQFALLPFMRLSSIGRQNNPGEMNWSRSTRHELGDPA